MTDIATGEPTQTVKRGPAKGTPNHAARAKAEARRQIEDDKRKRYLEQEAKRATRVQIDQNPVLWTVIVLVGLTFIATAIWVANQTYAVSQFARLPFDWMGWLAFAGIEVAVLWSLLSYLTLNSRGEKAGTWFGVMLAYSGLTIATSTFHTLDEWQFAWLEPQLWAGVVIAAAVPLSFVLSVKALSRVVFAQVLSE